MQNNGIWPPPPTHQAPLIAPEAKPRFSLRVLLLAAGSGMLIGFIDIHLTTAQTHKSWVTHTGNYYNYLSSGTMC